MNSTEWLESNVDRPRQKATIEANGPRLLTTALSSWLKPQGASLGRLGPAIATSTFTQPNMHLEQLSRLSSQPGQEITRKLLLRTAR